MADDKQEEVKDENEQESKKKYSWSDKSRQERVQFKMLFLVFLAILFVFTAFIYIKSDINSQKKDEYETDNVIEESDDNSDELEKIEEKYTKNNNENKDEEEINEEPHDDVEMIEQDANEYEEKYIDQFGEDLINGLKKNSKTIMNMYYEQDTKNEKWKKLSTKDFQDKIKDNLSKKKKSADSYDVFSTKQYNDNEIILGVLVELDEKIEYYNLVYIEKNHEVRLDDIVFM